MKASRNVNKPYYRPHRIRSSDTDPSKHTYTRVRARTRAVSTERSPYPPATKRHSVLARHHGVAACPLRLDARTSCCPYKVSLAQSFLRHLEPRKGREPERPPPLRQNPQKMQQKQNSTTAPQIIGASRPGSSQMSGFTPGRWAGCANSTASKNSRTRAGIFLPSMVVAPPCGAFRIDQ